MLQCYHHPQLSYSTTEPFLGRKTNESLQRMAPVWAHFHRKGKVSGKAKGVRKAPRCQKLSNAVRGRVLWVRAEGTWPGAEGLQHPAGSSCYY